MLLTVNKTSVMKLYVNNSGLYDNFQTHVWFCVLLFSAVARSSEVTFVISRYERDSFVVPCGNVSTDPCKYQNAVLEKRDNSTCDCLCQSNEGSTFSVDNKTWKCFSNKVLRTQLQTRGIQIRFEGELPTSSLSLFPVWRSVIVYLNLIGSTTRTCRIDETTSYYQECNGTWAIIPQSSLITFAMRKPPIGTPYLFQGTGQYSLLQGRVVSVGINCSSHSSTEAFSVLLKVGGKVSCSGFLQRSEQTSVETTTSVPNVTSTAQILKNLRMISTTESSTVHIRTTNTPQSGYFPEEDEYSNVIIIPLGATAVFILVVGSLTIIWILKRKQRIYRFGRNQEIKQGGARGSNNSVEPPRANFAMDRPYEEIDYTEKIQGKRKEEPVYEEVIPMGESIILTSGPPIYRSLDRKTVEKHDYQPLNNTTKIGNKHNEDKSSEYIDCKRSDPLVKNSDGNCELIPTNCTEDLMDYCVENEEYTSYEQSSQTHTYLILEIPDSCPSGDTEIRVVSEELEI